MKSTPRRFKALTFTAAAAVIGTLVLGAPDRRPTESAVRPPTTVDDARAEAADPSNPSRSVPVRTQRSSERTFGPNRQEEGTDPHAMVGGGVAIRGRCRWWPSGDRAAGVDVRFEPDGTGTAATATTTSSLGAFELRPDARPGVSGHLVLSGRELSSRAIWVATPADGTPLEMDTLWLERTGHVRGRLVSNGEAPRAVERLTLTRRMDSEPTAAPGSVRRSATFEVAGDGQFLLRDVPAGIWAISVSGGGWQVAPPGVDVTVVWAEEARIEVPVRRLAPISGTVVDHWGRAIAGAKVFAQHAGRDLRVSSIEVTGDDGRFALRANKDAQELPVTVIASVGGRPGDSTEAEWGEQSIDLRTPVTLIAIDTVEQDGAAIELERAFVTGSGESRGEPIRPIASRIHVDLSDLVPTSELWAVSTGGSTLGPLRLSSVAEEADHGVFRWVVRQGDRTRVTVLDAGAIGVPQQRVVLCKPPIDSAPSMIPRAYQGVGSPFRSETESVLWVVENGVTDESGVAELTLPPDSRLDDFYFALPLDAGIDLIYAPVETESVVLELPATWGAVPALGLASLPSGVSARLVGRFGQGIAVLAPEQSGPAALAPELEYAVEVSWRGAWIEIDRSVRVGGAEPATAHLGRDLFYTAPRLETRGLDKPVTSGLRLVAVTPKIAHRPVDLQPDELGSVVVPPLPAIVDIWSLEDVESGRAILVSRADLMSGHVADFGG